MLSISTKYFSPLIGASKLKNAVNIINEPLQFGDPRVVAEGR